MNDIAFPSSGQNEVHKTTKDVFTREVRVAWFEGDTPKSEEFVSRTEAVGVPGSTLWIPVGTEYEVLGKRSAHSLRGMTHVCVRFDGKHVAYVAPGLFADALS
jgi:hypothetical protein